MSESQSTTVRDIVLICIRSVGSLSNAIIFVVLGLLFYFGEVQTAVFLSLAIVAGILIGVINDIRARLALERLQMLTTPVFTRVSGTGKEERVFAEALRVGDRIKLILGDQVPCDSTLASAQNLEISEALLTGESNSFPKKAGDAIPAGAILVAGSGIAIISTLFSDSQLSKMTSDIKRYSVNRSPIQQSIQTVITYSGYCILALLAFVVTRGYVVHEPYVDIIQNAAALTSTLVPQGLIVGVTILFAYGAIRLYRDKVLLQDVNATEKLGRIKNLCIDKTGTLTENVPTVMRMQVMSEGKEHEAMEWATEYIKGSGDSSQTARAIEQFASHPKGDTIHWEVIGSVPFTSTRQFGAVELKREEQQFALIMGVPDILLPHMTEGNGKEWLERTIQLSKTGTRFICLTRADVRNAPQDLNGISLIPVALFELESKLRVGTKDIIRFFKERGVRIRVISGDNAETVGFAANEAGIENAGNVVSGDEIEKWSDADFIEKVDRYTVFARIKPEMKNTLIERFKAQGFTAMVGDGANDALAIKKADLGIAMFEGASATRQLAAVVLMDNSFAALPKGIQMADTIIGNIEVLSSLYFFEMGAGLILYIGATLLGFTYPISPQNMILINYFTVGFPGIVTFIWTMRGEGRTYPSSKPFLAKVLPFALWSSLAAGVLALILFMMPKVFQATHVFGGFTHTILILGFVFMSLVFFCVAPFVYTQGDSAGGRGKKLFTLLVFVLTVGTLLYIVFSLPQLRLFFGLMPPTSLDVFAALGVGFIFLALEFGYLVLMKQVRLATRKN